MAWKCGQNIKEGNPHPPTNVSVRLIGKSEVHTMQQCQCSFKDHSDLPRVESEVRQGTMTIRDAAQQLGVPEEEFWNHIQKCIIEKEEDVGEVDLFTLYNEMIFIMRKKLRKLEKTATSPTDIKALAVIASTVNQCAFNLAKLKKLVDVAPLVEIKNFQIELNQIQEFLVTSLCPTCQTKVMKFLEH